MNAVLDTLNAAMDAIIDALAVALAATARSMLANVSTAEWVLAVTLAGSAWMLSSGRGWRALGLVVFSMAVGAGAWLNWRAGRHGMAAQQAVLAAMVLHGGLGAQRFAVVKGGK